MQSQNQMFLGPAGGVFLQGQRLDSMCPGENS